MHKSSINSSSSLCFFGAYLTTTTHRRGGISNHFYIILSQNFLLFEQKLQFFICGVENEILKISKYRNISERCCQGVKFILDLVQE